jgi:hypothetical protein
MKRGLALLLFLGLSAQACFGELFIVAPKNYPSDSISKKDLRRLYLGLLTYHNDHRVTLCQIDGDSLKEFCDKFLKLDVISYRQKWYSKIFTGKGELPHQFKTESDLVKFVATSQFALGYITSQTALCDEIKILIVNE